MIYLKKLIITWVCCVFWALTAHAQFSDDFSDGDYTSNPAWSGDNSKFVVSAGELRLNAPALDETAYLSTSSQAIENAQWDFYVRLDFNPSSSNFARIYLVSNNSNLTGPLNGYYIQFGSADDDICLYRQTGTTRTKIIDGPNSLLSTNIADATVRVTRDAAGNWTLSADTLAGTGYALMGTATDATHQLALYFGVFCDYTQTRSDDFYFDNFVVTGNPVNDNTIPFVKQVTVNGNNGLNVLFSEPVSPATAQTPAHYNLSNGIGNPVSAVISGQNSSLVNLIFSANFQQNAVYTLFTGDVADFAGNVMVDTNIIVSLYQASPYEIIINEIMAAPDNPSFPGDLPNEEYVELYNRTPFPINLTGWQLVVNGSVDVLPACIIHPDSFIVIVDNDGELLFPPGLPIISVATSLGLTNSGAAVAIKDTSGQIMDYVNYDLSYYNNTLLDDGGYSMERVNPNEICVNSPNWRASLEPGGGTPGRKNFWYNTNPIGFSVQLEEVLSATEVRILFSKNLDSATVEPADFMVDQGIGSPDSVVMLTGNVAALYFSFPLSVNTLYHLTLSGTVDDCQGNSLTGAVMDLVLFQPQVFDLVINELMADPTPTVMLPPSEYVEIKNRTSLPLNLKNWKIKTASSTYTLPSCTILPDSFLVVTNQQGYFNLPGINAVALSSDVSLTNDGGTVSLVSPLDMVLHTVKYSIDWYRVTAKKDGGWSLEQIDTDKPCLAETNWMASTDSTGGTPGRTNSVNADTEDKFRPRMIRAGYSAPDTVFAYFNKAFIPASVDVSDFTVLNGGLSVISAIPVAPDYKKVALITGMPLNPDSIYALRLSGQVDDCSGNASVTDTVFFGIPESVSEGDILINEVLADPVSTGVDYVEVYNYSDHIIDLKNLRIASGDTLTGVLASVREISPVSLLLVPGEYLVLSESARIVQSQYITMDSTAFWDVADLPVYANAFGVVVICDAGLQVKDRLVYTQDMHFPLLNSTDGVALERISWAVATQVKSNWHSAAQTVGFGTPGYTNSQFVQLPAALSHFDMTPDIFSPDMDGYQDVLNIQYKFDEPGWVATVTITDGVGREIKKLVKNQLLATEGVFIWDGIGDNGDKARIGIYVVRFEVFNPLGEKQAFQKVCTVASRM